MDENNLKNNYQDTDSKQPTVKLNTENEGNVPEKTFQTTVQNFPETNQMVNSNSSLENMENSKNKNFLTKLMYIGLVVMGASLGIVLFIKFLK